MSCLGDPSRFQLVTLLLRGERCVSDLAQDVGLSQSCTTRHLQALQRERIVLGKRDGKRVLFRLRLDDSEVGALLSWAISERGARRGSKRRPAAGTTKADIPRLEAPGIPPAERSSPGRDERHVEPEPAPPRRPIRQDLEDFLL